KNWRKKPNSITKKHLKRFRIILCLQESLLKEPHLSTVRFFSQSVRSNTMSSVKNIMCRKSRNKPYWLVCKEKSRSARRTWALELDNREKRHRLLSSLNTKRQLHHFDEAVFLYLAIILFATFKPLKTTIGEPPPGWLLPPTK